MVDTEKDLRQTKFSEACEEQRVKSNRYPGGFGCLAITIISIFIAIAIGELSDNENLGLTLIFILIPILGISFVWIVNLLFIKPSRDQMESLIDDAIIEQKADIGTSHSILLNAHGLPHGNNWHIEIDLDTEHYNAIERTNLQHLVNNPTLHSIDKAVKINTGLIATTTFKRVKEILLTVSMGTYKSISNTGTVRDGRPFTLIYTKDGIKSSITGNLAGHRNDIIKIPEIELVELIFSLSKADLSGTASTDSKGEITIYSNENDQ
ncbi:MAG: hypothetical protein HRU15_08310 [Planctomycetes bacterium]|nr:hypothetical protein [Planctomycetota bacterium]